MRALAYASLGAFPDRQELVARLGHALAEDPSYNVRSGAAAALGHFVSYRTQAAPLLVAALPAHTLAPLVCKIAERRLGRCARAEAR